VTDGCLVDASVPGCKHQHVVAGQFADVCLFAPQVSANDVLAISRRTLAVQRPPAAQVHPLLMLFASATTQTVLLQHEY
jgi:hypothetical protein